MIIRGEEILARRNEAKKGELDEQLKVTDKTFPSYRSHCLFHHIDLIVRKQSMSGGNSERRRRRS